MDDISRRGFLLAGLGLLVSGCFEKRKDPFVLDEGPSTRTLTRYYPHSADEPAPSTRQTPSPSRAPGAPDVMPRSAWSSRQPIVSRLNPMNGIRAITVHHEGMPRPTLCTAPRDVISELRMVQASHIERMSAGDIGYHFIIDRSGRVWEGRPLSYQGAHVKDHNYHNIGVMVMGNFDIQFPTTEQKVSVDQVVAWLMKRYGVPKQAVYTHRELTSTACPGRHLQPHIDAFRRTV